jgi:O-methyltransferase
MDNIYITRLLDGKTVLSRRARFINRLLAKLGFASRLVNHGGSERICQKVNLYHMINQVLAYNVPGDAVELGCRVGKSAVVLARVLEAYAPERRLHVYDAFPVANAIDVLKKYFAQAGVTNPQIHEGWIEETVPARLPETICFAHIDVGSDLGMDLKALVLHCLEHVYQRMAPGAVCVLQSYCDPTLRPQLASYYRPEVKAAADEFFRDKPEAVSVLYSGDFGIHSHGYFRREITD